MHTVFEQLFPEIISEDRPGTTFQEDTMKLLNIPCLHRIRLHTLCALGLTLGLALTALGPAGAAPLQAPALASDAVYDFSALDVQNDNPQGAASVAGLTAGPDGTLYGVAQAGGANGAGTLFKVSPDGTGFAVLHTFSPVADGAAPWGTLALLGGTLYGTTSGDGMNGGGTVFSLHTDGTGFAVLHAFSDYTGYPLGGLTAGGDGFLYGTTAGGQVGIGTVYRIAPDGTGFSVLHSFASADVPMGSLLVGADGILYGTTAAGGDNAQGSVFTVHTDGTGYVQLYSFAGGADGGFPQAGLTSIGDGFLYGTTSDSGLVNTHGTVFKIAADGTGFATLYSFSGGGDGDSPYAPLALGTDGKLYGTTFGGGAAGLGTIFAVGPDGTGFATLASLSGAGGDGGSPQAGLTLGTDGRWYGTASSGGPGGTGAVFVLATPAPAIVTSTPPAPAHTHVLWNNPDGKVMLWNVAPDGTYTSNTFGPYTDDGTQATPWHASALATGPDGKSHILWTNPDGRVILWTVDDSGSFTYQVYGPYTDGAAGTPWSATSLSVGPDNVAHILWTNPDGRVILWNVDSGFSFTYGVFGPYTDDGTQATPWHASALSTGPDGLSHILWTNPDNRVILWNVDSAFTFSYGVYDPYVDGVTHSVWSASALSTGADGVSHVLWTDPSRRVTLWNVDSAFNAVQGVLGAYTDGTAALWSASALATTSDGLSHLLMNSPDGRLVLLNADSGFTVTPSAFGPFTDSAQAGPQSANPNALLPVWTATAVSAGP